MELVSVTMGAMECLHERVVRNRTHVYLLLCTRHLANSQIVWHDVSLTCCLFTKWTTSNLLSSQFLLQSTTITSYCIVMSAQPPILNLMFIHSFCGGLHLRLNKFTMMVHL